MKHGSTPTLAFARPLQRRRLARVLILLTLVVGLAAVPALAQTDQAPRGLSFAERSLSVTADELQAGVQVTVLNNTAQQLVARVRLTSLSLESTSASPTPVPTDAIEIKPRGFAVPAAGEVIVALQASAAELAKGSYNGRLAVYDEATNAVDRIPIAVLAPGAATTAVTPAVSTLSATTDLHNPLAGAVLVQLPLDVSKGDPILTPGTSVGLLSDGKGGVAAATILDGQLSPTATAGVKQTALTITGITRTGSYKGTINLAPDTQSGSVALQVDAQDWWLWPLLALVAGIVVALSLLHARGVVRPGLVLLLEVAKARKDIRSKEAELRKAMAANGWTGYTISAAAAAEADALEAAVKQLGRTSFDALDAEQRAALVARIDRLNKAADTLGSLAVVLADLDRKLAVVESLPSVTGLADEKRPAQFVAGARAHFFGHEVKTLAALDQVLVTAIQTRDLAAQWPLLHDRTEQAFAHIKAAGTQAGQTGHKLIVTARGKLAAAWLLLCQADNAGMVADDRLREQLSVAVALANEAAEIVEAEAAGVQRGAKTVTESGHGLFALVPPLTHGTAIASLPSPTEARIVILARTIRRVDLLQIVFAAAVALFTGLTALYWGKTFGSWQDYVAAFLWGSLAASALDALMAAIRTRVAPFKLS